MTKCRKKKKCDTSSIRWTWHWFHGLKCPNQDSSCELINVISPNHFKTYSHTNTHTHMSKSLLRHTKNKKTIKNHKHTHQMSETKKVNGKDEEKSSDLKS